MLVRFRPNTAWPRTTRLTTRLRPAHPPRLVTYRSALSTRTAKKYDIVFMGSDLFSVLVLTTLLELSSHINRVHAVTPPGCRVGRGRKTEYRPPLLVAAEERGIPVEELRRAEPQRRALEGWTVPPEWANTSSSALLITASFPYFVPRHVLQQFLPLHCLNVHPSLLPRYRGAAPIQRQLAHEDYYGGVTLQDLSPLAFDKGRILDQSQLTFDHTTSFHDALRLTATAGGRLLAKALEDFDIAKARAREQLDDPNALHAAKISRLDGVIRWQDWPAAAIRAKHLAYGHQAALQAQLSGGWTFYLRPAMTTMVPSPATRDMLSDIGSAGWDQSTQQLIVRCTEDVNGQPTWLAIEELKAAQGGGKGWVLARAWWNGRGKKMGSLRFVPVATQ